MYLSRDTDFMISEMSCKTIDRKENNKWDHEKKKGKLVWK